jgi:malate dehydrogenase (quinone)
MKKKMAVPSSPAVGSNTPRTNTRHEQETDVLLIGGGIMSATLGTWLQELEPDWSITMVEQMSSVAEESSNGWNNAGTGHAALMELNYTPQTASGINIDKAVDINESFHISRQFWAHQVTRGILSKPKSFINSVPHMSFVWGEDNVNFLRARYAALQQSELFRGIRYSEDHQQIKEWAPLVMEGRDPQQKVAATRTEVGTDVNYGEITRQLIAGLQTHDNFSLQLGTVVRRFKRNADKSWTVTLADADNRRQKRVIKAKFIFIGAGGAALTLLAGNRYSSGERVRGLPGGRSVPGVRKPGGGEPSSGESLWSGRSGRAADVGSAYRYADYRWQAGGTVRAVRDLLDPLPEKRFAVGSAGINQHLEYSADAQCRSG